MYKENAPHLSLLYGPYREILEEGLVVFEEDYRGTFVEFYEVIQKGQEDLPFFERFIQSYGDPILELGCGTGRLLIPLAEKGHTITGIDNSPDMLKIIRRKVAELPDEVQQRITLYKMDMQDFHLQAAFSVIIIAMDTFLCLPKQEDRLRTLRCVYEHLKERGVFIVDISVSEPPAGHTSPSLRLFCDPVHKDRCLISICQEFYREKTKSKVLNFLNIWFREGKSPTLTISAAEEWYGNPKELEKLLQQTGFQIQGTYRDYKCNPYKEGDTNFIVVAERY